MKCKKKKKKTIKFIFRRLLPGQIVIVARSTGVRDGMQTHRNSSILHTHTRAQKRERKIDRPYVSELEIVIEAHIHKKKKHRSKCGFE